MIIYYGKLTKKYIQYYFSNPQLEFVAAPALAPPEVQVDTNLMQQYNNEMEEAAQQPLPEEDDDL